MATRPTFQKQRNVLRAPATQSFKGMEAWIQTSVTINNAVNNKLDSIATDEATRRGAKDGLERDEEGKLSFHTVDGTTLRGRAYNQAGTNAYTSALDGQVRAKFSEIHREFKHNPEALRTNLEAYASGIKKDVTKQAPDAAGSIEGRMQSTIATMMDISINAAQEQILETASTNVTSSISALSNDSVFAVRNATNRDQALRVITENRQRLHRMLLSNGPKGAFTTDKTTFIDDNLMKELGTDAPSSDRTGIFTTKEIQATIKGYDDSMAEEQVVWGLKQAMEVNGGIDYITAFRDDKSGTLSPEQKDKIQQRLFSEMATQSKLNTAMGKEESDSRKLLWDTNEARVTVQLLEDTLEKDTLTELVRDGELDPAIAKTYAKLIEGGAIQTDDPNELLEIQMRGVENLTEQEIVTNPNLTLETKRELIEDRQKIVEDQANWRNSQQAREASQRIDREFGIVAGSLQNLDPEAAKLAGRLKTEWYDTIESLPPEEREFQSLNIAKRVIAKKKQFKAEDAILKQEIRLENMEFPTEEELDAAIEMGDDRVTGMFGSEKTSEVNAIRQELIRRNRIIDRNKKLLEEFIRAAE